MTAKKKTERREPTEIPETNHHKHTPNYNYSDDDFANIASL